MKYVDCRLHTMMIPYRDRDSFGALSWDEITGALEYCPGNAPITITKAEAELKVEFDDVLFRKSEMDERMAELEARISALENK